MRHLFIINRHAGKSAAYENIEKQLKNPRDNVYIEYTKSRGDATVIARKFVENSGDFVRIYACGGDGTFNEVINGVYDLENCAVAPVPTGSGNDFIRSFGMEKEEFLDVDKIISGKVIDIDLLKCGDKISCNSITVGYDCAVAKNVDKFKKRRFISASLAYKLSIFYCLITERKHDFNIIADGEELKKERTYLLSVSAKGKYYGGGIKCSPYADNSDGFIDFMAIYTVGIFKFISLLPSFIKGKHIDNPKIDFILHKKVNTISYLADKPFEIGIDGEIFTVERADIELLPKAQKIILPKN